MQCVHDCNLLFRDDDSLGMDSSAVVQQNREIPQSSAPVIRCVLCTSCVGARKLCLQPVRSALSALPSASAIDFVGSASASVLGFVGSAFSQCARLCRLCLQPVRSALSALPSASVIGFVGSAFSQCARLCRLCCDRLCYNYSSIFLFEFFYFTTFLYI